MKYNFRPAYMDDYEVLETDLQAIYNDYMMKFRNMVYLEESLEEYQKSENERNEVDVLKSFQNAICSLFLRK